MATRPTVRVITFNIHEETKSNIPEHEQSDGIIEERIMSETREDTIGIVPAASTQPALAPPDNTADANTADNSPAVLLAEDVS